MSGVSPADAIDGDVAGDVAEAAADHASAEGAADDVGAGDVGRPGGSQLKDALLSTEPDLSPSRAKRSLEVGDTGAHAYVGARKFLAGLGFSGDGEGGTPALVHFAIAGVSHLTGDGDQEASDDVDDRDDRDVAALEAGDEFVDPAGGGV